jgi:hypothetical protein
MAVTISDPFVAKSLSACLFGKKNVASRLLRYAVKTGLSREFMEVA